MFPGPAPLTSRNGQHAAGVTVLTSFLWELKNQRFFSDCVMFEKLGKTLRNVLHSPGQGAWMQVSSLRGALCLHLAVGVSVHPGLEMNPTSHRLSCAPHTQVRQPPRIRVGCHLPRVGFQGLQPHLVGAPGPAAKQGPLPSGSWSMGARRGGGCRRGCSLAGPREPRTPLGRALAPEATLAHVGGLSLNQGPWGLPSPVSALPDHPQPAPSPGHVDALWAGGSVPGGQRGGEEPHACPSLRAGPSSSCVVPPPPRGAAMAPPPPASGSALWERSPTPRQTRLPCAGEGHTPLLGTAGLQGRAARQGALRDPVPAAT